MKNIPIFLILTINLVFAQNSTDSIIKLSEVNATFLATIKSPINHQNIPIADIKSKSVGQEPSILLSNTPSITYSVDGGHSQGYSYFRMRGLDQTRINITIDGVPLNDPMDQAFYFSNFANLLGSVEMIQIQRGVGISKNGNASYAGSIELFSKKLSDPQSFNFDIGYGSYNSFKTSAFFNSGIKNGKGLNLRVSKIYSDGYKNHSLNNSHSLNLSGGVFLDKSIWKLSVLAGNQKNGLAWMSVPENDINCCKTTNANSEFEEDDFTQVQTKINNTFLINKNNSIKSTIYYTFAEGWWNFDLDNYYGVDSNGTNITKNEINSGMLGFFSNYEYLAKSLKFNFGIHGNTYKNNYIESDANLNSIFYDVNRFKEELSTYTKVEFNLGENFLFSSDIQFRKTSFDYEGDVMKFREISWSFINPKIGLSYISQNNDVIYVSFASTGREPAKYDMFQGNDILSYVPGALDGDTYEYIGPEYGNQLISKNPEFVNDFEFGIRKRFENFNMNLNFFYMDFKNERILNGQTGPSGLALRSRVDNSLRTGLEFFGELSIFKNLKLTNNSSYNYSSVIQNDIEFIPILTPEIIINQEISYSIKNATLSLSARYQSKSYMNFENSESLGDYFLLNARIDYKYGNYYTSLFLNNVTDIHYFNNGEVNSEGQRSYWVQPPRNFFVSLGFNF